MPVLMFDEKSLRLSVRLALEESYQPDEEIKKLEAKSVELRDKYMKLMTEVKAFLADCETWNKAHEVEKGKP